MKIISAARLTGKSTYIKDAYRNALVVVPNEAYNQHHKYNNSITIDMLLKHWQHLDWGCRARDFDIVFEEPGLYSSKFLAAMRIQEIEESTVLVIGTPVSAHRYDEFNMFLEWNKKNVIIWSHHGESRNKYLRWRPDELKGVWRE